MRSLRQYRSRFSTQSKLRRLAGKAMALFVAEMLKSQVLLTSVIVNAICDILTPPTDMVRITV